MKNLFLLFLLFQGTIYGQVIEDFEDGNKANWIESETGHWEVTTENSLSGNYSLHHSFDNPSSGHDQISLLLSGLQLNLDQTHWKFKLRHSYPTSSNNNWAVFLLSDSDAQNMHPGATSESIVLGVNFTGSDDSIKVWKCSSGINEVIFNTGFNWQDEVLDSIACFEISRSADGYWELYIGSLESCETPVSLGSFYNDDNFLHPFFGLYYEYSSAQDKKIWFDDLNIEGYFVKDTIPPVILSSEFVSSHQIVLNFNEPIQAPDLSDTIHFLLDNNIGHPFKIRKTASCQLSLFFSQCFVDERLHTLILNSVSDLTGNVMLVDTLSLFYYIIKPYDIVINEIMADPIPSISLPESEYIELINASNYELMIEKWILGVGSKETLIPKCTIAPGGYIILCDEDDTLEFKPFGRVLSMNSLPILNNSGQSLYLKDSSSIVMSHLNYDISWYQDDYKSEGGWALEQIDPHNPCSGKPNWLASKANEGGSPGTVNSIFASNPDFSAPALTKAIILGDSILEVSFNESYDRLLAYSLDFYRIDHSFPAPYCVELIEPDFMSLKLYFHKSFDKNLLYTLTLKEGFSDCAGNTIFGDDYIMFGIPAKSDSLSIVLNEILFNPRPNGVDFIELFNRSSSIIDLSDLRIASRDINSLELKSITPLSNSSQLILPGEYFAFTTDIDDILMQYPFAREENILKLSGMPSYPNDNGRAVLLDKGLHIIDEMTYSEKMHFPLLVSVEGVSLERLHPDKSSWDETNWHSASESIGFATPGQENSQYLTDIETADPVYVEPEIFSPDNDGHEDLSSLYYAFTEPGYVANVIVFDALGHRIQVLANNELLGTSGSFVWDGRNSGGELVGRGIYVFFMEVFNLKGNLKVYKKICVLAARF